MKKTIILSVLIALSATVTAQTDTVAGYKSIFGHESTVWNGVEEGIDVFFSYELRTDGDTTIGDYQYKKCYRSIVSHIPLKTNNGDPILLREDTLSGKVWFNIPDMEGYGDGIDTDYLLMDMSLQAGDSIDIGNQWFDVYSVTFVDSVKHINLRDRYGSYQISFIEGVGASDMLCRCIRGFVSNDILTCCHKDGELVFHNSGGYDLGDNECILRPLIISECSADSAISISPNPASGTVIVRSAERMTDIEVLDIVGNTMMVHKASGLTAKLDVGTLPRGTYIVRIHTPMGTASRKLLLQ